MEKTGASIVGHHETRITKPGTGLFAISSSRCWISEALDGGRPDKRAKAPTRNGSVGPELPMPLAVHPSISTNQSGLLMTVKKGEQMGQKGQTRLDWERKLVLFSIASGPFGYVLVFSLRLVKVWLIL